jgi:hypothetical protein
MTNDQWCWATSLGFDGNPFNQFARRAVSQRKLELEFVICHLSFVIRPSFRRGRLSPAQDATSVARVRLVVVTYPIRRPVLERAKRWQPASPPELEERFPGHLKG